MESSQRFKSRYPQFSSVTLKKQPVIAVIGTGTIGRAIVESLINHGFRGKIIATRRRIEEIMDLTEKGIEVTRNNRKAAKNADIIMLCIKPFDIKSVLQEIKDEIKGKLVISFVTAVPLKFLKKIAPNAKFIRAMPNVAVLAQASFTAYCTDPDVTDNEKEVAKEIFKAMGTFWEVDEKYMDAITGLSGSAPAYIATIIEAMMYAGLKVGLPRELALYSSIYAVLGTAKLALNSKKHIAELKDMVVTPGGVTIEGIYELEDSRIRTAIMRAIEAATQKSRKIAKIILSEIDSKD